MATILVTGLFGGIAGCNSKDTAKDVNKTVEVVQDTQKEEKTKDTVEIDYWVAMNGNAISVVQNYGELNYFKELEKITGVKINFLHPPVGQEAEQFKLLIASRNDLPDIIEYDWMNYPGGPEKAIKDGIIITVNDLIEQAPNYKSALASDQEIEKQAKTDNGNMYAFHTLNEADYKTYGGLILRDDWLKELGLDAPTTLAELEEVLIAFKAKGVEYPLCITSNYLLSGAELINTAFEVGNGFYLDDTGAVKFGPAEPGYKEYISTLNRWYKEGLLDPDFASIDSKTIDSNILNGKTGVMFGWIGSGMGKWMNGSDISLAAMPNPVMNKGDQGKFVASYFYKVGFPGAAITTNADNIDSIVSMFDYLYTEEGKLLKNFGIEGEHYNMVDGTPTYTDLILKNPEGLSPTHAMSKYFQSCYPAPGWAEVPEYTAQYYQLESQIEARDIYNLYGETASKHIMPRISATPEESKDLANIMTDISTYKDEMLVAFITGVEPLDNFDKYVETLNGFGLDRALDIKEAGLERYNNR